MLTWKYLPSERMRMEALISTAPRTRVTWKKTFLFHLIRHALAKKRYF